MMSTSGNATNDFTEASHVCPSTALATASPFTSGCSLDQRAACTTSSGYVEAMNTCANNASGYKAMGATICSSSSGLNSGDLGWAVACVAVVAGSAARAESAPICIE